jgi:hypothetical protein
MGPQKSPGTEDWPPPKKKRKKRVVYKRKAKRDTNGESGLRKKGDSGAQPS